MVTFKDVHSAEMKATYKGLPQATRDQYEAQALVEKNDFAMCRQSAKVGRQAADSAIRREAAAAEAIVAEAIEAPFGGKVVVHEDGVRIGRGSAALSTLCSLCPAHEQAIGHHGLPPLDLAQATCLPPGLHSMVALGGAEASIALADESTTPLHVERFAKRRGEWPQKEDISAYINSVLINHEKKRNSKSRT